MRSPLLSFASLLLPAALLAGGCAASGQGAHIPEADRGVWMTGDQFNELLVRGTVHDSVGQAYNMHPIPGYDKPAERARKGWRVADRIYARYGDPAYWEGLRRAQDRTKEGSRAFGHRLMFETPKEAFTTIPEGAMENITWNWGLKGAGRPWRENFEIADEAVGRRAFGWFLAYPWATLCSLGDNLIRVPAGVVGGPAIAVGSYAFGAGCVVVGASTYAGGELTRQVILPTGYAIGPAIGGTAVAAGAAVAPLPEWAWTTVATPGAAVLCGRPNPDRVVNHWFTRMDDPAEATHKNDPARRIRETLPQKAE